MTQTFAEYELRPSRRNSSNKNIISKMRLMSGMNITVKAKILESIPKVKLKDATNYCTASKQYIFDVFFAVYTPRLL